jgi:hypothetical protein
MSDKPVTVESLQARNNELEKALYDTLSLLMDALPYLQKSSRVADKVEAGIEKNREILFKVQP